MLWAQEDKACGGQDEYSKQGSASTTKSRVCKYMYSVSSITSTNVGGVVRGVNVEIGEESFFLTPRLSCIINFFSISYFLEVPDRNSSKILPGHGQQL